MEVDTPVEADEFAVRWDEYSTSCREHLRSDNWGGACPLMTSTRIPFQRGGNYRATMRGKLKNHGVAKGDPVVFGDDWSSRGDLGDTFKGLVKDSGRAFATVG